MHRKQYTVDASNPHYLVNCIMYVLNVNYYSTVNPVFDDVCFVLLLWPFSLISKDVWFGFQLGHDYTQFPNLNARLLSYDSYLQLLSTNFSISSFTVITCLVLYGLEIGAVLLQNKMM